MVGFGIVVVVVVGWKGSDERCLFMGGVIYKRQAHSIVSTSAGKE